MRPAPSSIAEKIKKKKVRERIFRSSNKNPVNKATTKRVIQINSAIIRACTIEYEFKQKIMKREKNKIIEKFNSEIDTNKF